MSISTLTEHRRAPEEDSEPTNGVPAEADEATPALPVHATISPPDDDELWSYVANDGKRFLQFSAFSRVCLGSALVFLSFTGNWLVVLLPFALAVVIGGFINIVWSTQIPAFDRARHMRWRNNRRSEHNTPTVDVFICTCGEDPIIVENTIVHAFHLDHPREKLNVYVLDDRDSPEVHQAALRWGATYISRPDRGWMKKAGNLRHGYEQSDGDLIIILDADFAVRSDFLSHTVPYFDDEKLGILQTPQFFRVTSDNWVERGAAAQQEQFYRVGMRARDKHGGAICVGTNAVYRRAALEERGGMALLEHSEDIFTGLKVIDAGYRVDYLPLPLAAGTAPDNAASLASQQYRWARGNFALAGTPLFKRMKLTPMQRLGMWDGWIFYVTSALSPLVAIYVPVVSLAEAPYVITLAPAAMILPALFTEFYLQPRWLHLPDGRASRRVGLVSQVAHLYALRDHLTDRDQEWIPTGGKVSIRERSSSQGTDRIPEQIAVGALVGFLVIMGLLTFRVATGWPLIDLAPVGILAAIALPAALGTSAAPVISKQPVELSAPDNEGGRDAFLDMVRTISIVRVMFWHALGYWWISWSFAAMPAVFYVSGALMVKSMRNTGCWQVVKGRLERLIPPYYAYIALSLSAVALAVPDVAQDSRRDVISWLIPYRAPATLPWEAGWLSAPLWFLRALVIILVLTPLVRPIGRRIPGVIQFAAWALSLFVLDRWVAQQSTAHATAVARGVADIICFGGFFTLGMSGHKLRHKLTRRVRFQLVVALGTGAVAWALISPPTDMVVNNSYVLFGLVGLAWLGALLSIEDHLRHLGEIDTIRRFVGWITKWAMSIYLWHTLALVFAYRVVGGPRSAAHWVLFGAVFSVLLRVVVAAVRPLETMWMAGNRRRPRPRLGLVLALIVAVGVLLPQANLFPEFADDLGPPTPSGRPPVGGEVSTLALLDPSPEQLATMARSAEAWLIGHGVESMAVVEIGAPTGDRPVTVQFGAPEALDPAAPFEALSLTKTMVAAVALQLVAEGTLTLDGPLPPLEGISQDVTDGLTLRRLLSHATGLDDYRQTADFRPDGILTPLDAVAMSVRASDLSSTVPSYAASNYLMAGLTIEAATGQPLSEVLDDRIFTPLGMTNTELVNNQRAGFVGHGSGGVVSTLDDLARWYGALMRDGTVLSPEMRDQMLFGGQAYQGNAGLGAWRHCPCDPPSDLDPEPFLYAFHDGGDARLVYIPSRDVVLAMRFSKPLYDEDRIVGDIDDVIFAVADRRTFLAEDAELISEESN